MTSDGARVNLPQKTKRLVRRIAALVTLIGALGAFAVAAGNLRFPFLGFWYLFAPVAASVMAAIVLRGGGVMGPSMESSGQLLLANACGLVLCPRVLAEQSRRLAGC